MNPFVHDPAWGWWIVWYFYLGGLAAGCYFLATLIELCGREEDRPLARLGYRVTLPLILVCGVLLIVDLDRPERFWHMVLQSEVVDQALEEGFPWGGWGTMAGALMLKWWSPMSLGAQALGLFGLCSFISFLGTFRSSPRPGSASRLWRRWLSRVFKILGCVVGFFVAAYTGALLAATNQPLWAGSEWISPLFLTSSASTGIALLLLLGRRPLTSAAAESNSQERLEAADLWALGLELGIFLVFLASLRGVLPLALTTWEGQVLVLGTLGIGLLAPLWLHLRFKRRTPHAGARGDGRMVLAAVCALAGGFLLRFGIVGVAPALLERYPDIQPSDLEAPLAQSWVGIALLTGTAVAAVLIPYCVARHGRFTRGQTVLGSGLSVLVLAGVTAFCFSPTSAPPWFEPLPGVPLSPEDGRQRGGGPGASGVNRPAQPFFRSKLGAMKE